MKYFLQLIIVLTILLLSSTANAQITNLTVIGVSANFTVATGDSFYWSFHLPVGGTATLAIWYDVNQNGTVDPGTDYPYATFYQVDGVSQGNNGPGDMDGTANGVIVFGQKIGLVPGKYIMVVSNGGYSVSIAGTVTALVSPAHTISGHVTMPSGYSARGLMIEVKAEADNVDRFWDGITDASGNYSIGMNSDTSGNPWRVNISNYPGNLIPNRADTTFVIASGNYTVNFTFILPIAQVAGIVRDESGNPISNIGVHLNTSSGSSNRDVTTDNNGKFQLGLSADDISQSGLNLQTNTDGDVTSTMLQTICPLPTIHSGDSLYRVLIVYSANSQINGQLLINGAAPGFSMRIIAYNQDTAQASAYVNASTGNFSIPVSNKIYNYNVFPIDLNGNYFYSPVTAHPGESGVVLNLTTSIITYAAKVTGRVINESGNPLSNKGVAIYAPSLSSMIYGITDGTGFFQIELPDNALQLSQMSLFTDFNGDSTGNVLSGTCQLPLINRGDSLYRVLVVYSANSTISGHVLLDGAPAGISLNITAINPDSAMATTVTEAGTGNFTIPVSNKISWYVFVLRSQNHSYLLDSIIAHPGETGVVINFVTGQVGWLMVSVPYQHDVYTKNFLFNDAASNAFIFNPSSGYVSKDSLQVGFGYWLKFNAGSPPIVLDGTSVTNVTIPVFKGWNMIGSISNPVPVNTITSNPPGMALSSFFVYKAGYVVTDTIKPGKGYWVKADQAGTLTLGSSETYSSQSRVHIVPTNDLPPSPPGTLTSNAVKVPTEFKLEQNYPNPFNPTTNISFAIPKATMVSLKVFDVLGREVQSLVNQQMEPGNYSVTVDGSKLTTGIYFYRLKTEEYSNVKKFLLVK